jgi:purine-binding chemotaxis protein CheW
MVDLAKIRKKAKKILGSDSPSAPVDGSTTSHAPEHTAPELDAAASQVRDAAKARPFEDASGVSKLERFKAEAGKRREIRIEAVVEAAQQLELLTFLIAGEQYAIDIEHIVEIVTPRPVTRIPNADESVVGIISLRGTIVTLVDVRRKLRHPVAPQAGEETRIVVIDFHNETVGFVVDRVLRVVKIAPGEVEPHPVVHTNELQAAIRGVFRASGALTILLDLDKLLDHSRWT